MDQPKSSERPEPLVKTIEKMDKERSEIRARIERRAQRLRVACGEEPEFSGEEEVTRTSYQDIPPHLVPT